VAHQGCPKARKRPTRLALNAQSRAEFTQTSKKQTIGNCGQVLDDRI
jgi:hypothetical protein